MLPDLPVTEQVQIFHFSPRRHHFSSLFFEQFACNEHFANGQLGMQWLVEQWALTDGLSD
jgi:hypothetical protein